jgi:protein phosphatase
MDCHAVTDAGRRRSENEDQFLIADLVKAVRIQTTSLNHDDRTEVTGPSHGKVFLVADGMSGHSAGRRASTLAVDEMINYMVNRMRWFAFSRLTAGSDDRKGLSTGLVGALKYCQQKIRDEADWNPDKRGMGTTLTVALLDWPALHVVHVGDSRCYIDHEDRLEQMTRDHTVAQVFVDAGKISEQEAEKSSLGKTLWNVVGGPNSQLEPEVYHAELSIGDTLLLCTDGLTRHVSDEEIAYILRNECTAEQTCCKLIEMANANGGSDNITVVVARFHDTADAPDVFEAEAVMDATSPKLDPEWTIGPQSQMTSTAEPPIKQMSR